jgi:hypothetical protein
MRGPVDLRKLTLQGLPETAVDFNEDDVNLPILPRISATLQPPASPETDDLQSLETIHEMLDRVTARKRLPKRAPNLLPVVIPPPKRKLCVEQRFVMRRIEKVTHDPEFVRSDGRVVSRRFPPDLFMRSNGGPTLPIRKAKTRVSAPEHTFWDTETVLD